MEREVFYQKMGQSCERLDIELTKKQKEQFFYYMELLIEWNQKMNLTTIIEPDDIIMKHFIDSITILKEIKDGDKVIDVGTGAGFPGIPIKIMNPSIKVTLLDSLKKRTIFLEEVVSKLELKEVKIIHGRAEEIGRKKEERETYNIATSRAVASLNVLLEYLIPFVNIGGKCICMKGSDILEECEKSQIAIQKLGGGEVEIERFLLPDTEMKRTIVKVPKERCTPNYYPRKAGTPSKQPIQ